MRYLLVVFTCGLGPVTRSIALSTVLPHPYQEDWEESQANPTFVDLVGTGEESGVLLVGCDDSNFMRINEEAGAVLGNR